MPQVTLVVDPAMPAGAAWLSQARALFATFNTQHPEYTVAMANGAAYMLDAVDAV